MPDRGRSGGGIPEALAVSLLPVVVAGALAAAAFVASPGFSVIGLLFSIGMIPGAILVLVVVLVLRVRCSRRVRGEGAAVLLAWVLGYLLMPMTAGLAAVVWGLGAGEAGPITPFPSAFSLMSGLPLFGVCVVVSAAMSLVVGRKRRRFRRGPSSYDPPSDEM